MNQSEVSISYNSEYLDINFKPKSIKTNLYPFQAIGRINSMKNNNEKNDIFKHLRKVNKAAFDLFDDLKDNRDPVSNICIIDTTKMTISQKRMFQSRIRELKKANIIRKVKKVCGILLVTKNSFMLNPYLIKCPKNVEGTETIWNLLK